MHKLALLRQCDAVLSCQAVSNETKTAWLALRDKVQPSFASIFGDMFGRG